MAKPKPGAEIRIAEAALYLAARKGWERVTLDDIARAAKLPITQVKKLFPDKPALLTGIVRFVDARMNAALGKPDMKGKPHDRLFETFMARFDVLQENRRAFIAIMDGVRREPRLMRHLLPAQIRAMRGMLDRTGIEPDARYEVFAVAGLLGIYGFALCVWRNDASADMAKTMAALDKALRRGANFMDILFRRPSRL